MINIYSTKNKLLVFLVLLIHYTPAFPQKTVNCWTIISPETSLKSLKAKDIRFVPGQDLYHLDIQMLKSCLGIRNL